MEVDIDGVDDQEVWDRTNSKSKSGASDSCESKHSLFSLN